MPGWIPNSTDPGTTVQVQVTSPLGGLDLTTVSSATIRALIPGQANVSQFSCTFSATSATNGVAGFTVGQLGSLVTGRYQIDVNLTPVSGPVVQTRTDTLTVTQEFS